MFSFFDYDQTFYNTPNAEVLPVNQLATKKTISQYFDTLFMSRPSLDFVASCRCGNLQSNFLLGTVCSNCNTEVATNFADQLRFKVWLEIPPYAPPILTPQAYSMLQKCLGAVRSGNRTRKLLDVLLDPNGELPAKYAKRITCGMRSFHENFDEIMATLFEIHGHLKSADNMAMATALREVIRRYRHAIFARHMPILDPSLHLVTKYGKSMSIDPQAPKVISAILELSVLVHTYNNGTAGMQQRIDRQTYKFAQYWYQYTLPMRMLFLFRKYCQIRRAALGSRLHFTFRAVIVPIVGERDADIVELPWSVGVSICKLEILNLLCNRYGKTMYQAEMIFDRAQTQFDPIVREILDTLIRECPYKGLPVLVNRNPSIRFGAIQLLFGIVKDDPTDTTWGISPLVITAPNADHDGDNMNGVPIKEMGEVPHFMSLHPMMTMLTSNTPGLSENVYPSAQAAIGLQAYITEPSHAIH